MTNNKMQPFTTHHLSLNSITKHLRQAQTGDSLGNVVHPRAKEIGPLGQVINESLPAACTVYVTTNTDQWTGSAFHVGGGYLVTAGHVIPAELEHQEYQISIAFDGHTLIPVEIMVTEPNYDCGIINCKRIPPNIPYLKLGDSNKVRQGDDIAVIGSPEGWNDTAAEGIIANLHQSLGEFAPTPAWNDIIFISADILEGASGAMVVGTDALVYGSVMGVTGQNAKTLGQGMHAVCPSNKIRKLLYSVGFSEASSG